MRRAQAIPITTYRRRQRMGRLVRRIIWLLVALVAVLGLASPLWLVWLWGGLP